MCCLLHSMATIIWQDNVGESVLETKMQVLKGHEICHFMKLMLLLGCMENEQPLS